jgi:hypothetical protein
VAKLIRSAHIRDLLDALEKHRKVKDGHVSYEGFQFEQYATVLTNSYEFDPLIPRRARRSLIRGALFEYRNKRGLDPDGFLTKLNEMESGLLNQAETPYWIRTSISMRGLEKKQNGRFSDISYSISRFEEHLRGRELELFKRFSRQCGYDELPTQYSTVWIRANGRSATDAGYRALEKFDVLRGIWNYSLNRHSFRQSSGHPFPVNPIVYGPIHTIHDENRAILDREWFYDPAYLNPVRPFYISDKWERVREDERIVRAAIRNRWFAPIVEDGTPLDRSFLRLWGCLEALTLTRKARYADTIKRAAAVFRDSWFIVELLEAFRDERNNHVHADVAIERSETLTYQLKSVVEGLLHFWVFVARLFRSKDEVEMFLDLPTEVADLKRRRKILDSAINFHQNY